MKHSDIPSEELEIFKSLDDIQIVFDIGTRADTSYLDLKPKATFHLFEPNPDYFEELKTKVGNKPNVHLNNFALGDADIYLRYNNILEAFEWGEAPFKTGDRILPIKTLDWYVENRDIKRIDFLKIDAEGYDYKILLGGKKAVDMARYIQYEYWDNKEQFHTLLNTRFWMKYIGNRNVICKKDE